jgi:hypothetical protein
MLREMVRNTVLVVIKWAGLHRTAPAGADYMYVTRKGPNFPLANREDIQAIRILPRVRQCNIFHVSFCMLLPFNTKHVSTIFAFN